MDVHDREGPRQNGPRLPQTERTLQPARQGVIITVAKNYSRRSDVLLQGQRQPVPPLSACRCLLAAVEPARADAQTLAVARGAVRHLAPPPDQDRRARGRAEDDDPASPTDGLPRPSHPAGRSRADAASGHMTDGAHTPRTQTHPDQPANLTDHTAGSEPAPAKPCQPPVTSRQMGPLAQAERRPGELLRLARLRRP